jgi:DNA-binding helix-hairpin-helix protein with protein kinase domain
MVRLKCENTNEYVELLNEISNSGEGIIYKTSKSGLLAKIYHKITSERIEKLRIMINNQPVDPTLNSQKHISIAWPKYLLLDSNNNPLGFLMPEIKDAQTLINVYNPRLRAKKASGFNWVYLHVTALNIAYIVHALHTKNYVIGDIKEQNLLVNSRGLVSIIDTDSFQIRDPATGKIYRGHVGSAEYTPPEMFNVDFSKVDRSELHDRFGLSIIIWQLLFANHPFSGQWMGSGNQPNIDKLIYQGDWIYGKSSNLRPAKFSIPLKVVHPEIERLFHKCFDDGCHQPYSRPSAFEWKESLEAAISDLVQCKVEIGHHYAKSYGSCYWCKRMSQINYDAFSSNNKTVLTKIPTVQSKIHTSTKPKLKPIPLYTGIVFISVGVITLFTGYYIVAGIAAVITVISWSFLLSD